MSSQHSLNHPCRGQHGEHKESTTKHFLVADLLSHHEQDALGHLTITLDRFIEIYKQTNKLSTPLHVHPTQPDPIHPTADCTGIPVEPTPQSHTPQQNTTQNTTQVQTTTTTMTHHQNNFVTALSLTTNPTPMATIKPLIHQHPNPPTPLQSPTINYKNNLVNANSISAVFKQAFPYHTTPPPTDSPNNPTPNFNYSQPQLPPIQTTLNPYNRHTNIINYSHEYTPQELEAIQTAESASLQAQEASRITTLNSLQESCHKSCRNFNYITTTPHPTYTTNHDGVPTTMPNTPHPTSFIHTTN